MYYSVLPLEAIFAGRGALPLFGDALPFLKSLNEALPAFFTQNSIIVPFFFSSPS